MSIFFYSQCKGRIKGIRDHSFKHTLKEWLDTQVAALQQELAKVRIELDEVVKRAYTQCKELMYCFTSNVSAKFDPGIYIHKGVFLC